MPAAKQTTQTSTAQGRFTMSLQDNVGKQLDQIGERIADAVEQASGVRIVVTRPQVVESLVKGAQAQHARKQAQADNGDAPQ